MRKALAALLVLGCLASAGCGPSVEETELKYRASVTAETVAVGRVESVLTTTGTVRARHSARVLAETGGKLTVLQNPRTRARWAVGDEVHRGQVVAIQDLEEIRTNNRIKARKKSLDAAESDYQRTLELYQEGLRTAQQLTELESHVETARADYEAAVLQESKGRLETPISGVLTTVMQEASGSRVAAGHVIVEVMNFDEVFVDLDLGTGEVLDVEPGQVVRVRSYASQHEFVGSVHRIAPAIDERTRTFGVEVAVDNPDRRLRPGMFVRADVVIDEREDAIVVPDEAIVEREGRLLVFVIEAQRAREREVRLGLVAEDVAEVIEGLSAGDRVVVSGQDTLQEGTQVILRG